MAGPISLAQVGSPRCTILVYGTTGLGKSVFCGSSQYQKTFIFDVEHGLDSVRAWPATRVEMVDIWPVTQTQDFYDGLNWLVNNVSKYGLVAVDTATELQRMLLQDVMKKANRNVATQAEWGVILNQMDYIGRLMRQLPTHVVWTCHEKTREENGTMIWAPSFQGAFAGAYAKHFSIIARYLAVDQEVTDAAGQKHVNTLRFLNCKKDAHTEAKDRYNALEKYEQPDIDMILYKAVTAVTNRGQVTP